MNSDSAATDSALNVYLGLYNQSPSTPADLTTFVATGSADLAALRTSFDTWSYDVDHTHPTDSTNKTALPLMKSYRDALNAWLSDQETQATGSKACLDAGPVSQSTLDCYQQLASSDAAAAQLAASRVNYTKQLVRAALQGH